MILVADSGGTGTTWMLLSNNSPIIFQTAGCHPGIVKPDALLAIMSGVFQEYQNTIQEIFFYGTGCSSEHSIQVISACLSQVFPNAKAQIQSDMVGAALAVLGDKKGVAGILGTGMNAAIVDHGKIIKNIVSLGFILGDEGSGVYIGKQLLKAVLGGQFSDEVTQAFYENTGYNRTRPDDIIAELYAAERYNEWLGKFAKTAKELNRFGEVQQLVQQCFRDFALVVKNLIGGQNINEIGLIGSVAFHYQDELKMALAEQDLTLETVLASPKDGLIAYHSR